MRKSRRSSSFILLLLVPIFLSLGWATASRTAPRVAPHAVPASGSSRQPVAPRARPITTGTLALARRDQQGLALARPDGLDLYDLTRRLKLHSAMPINPYIRATAPDYQVGRVDTFYVAQATSGFFSMKAELMLKTAHAYWYVQQNLHIPLDKLMPALEASARDFETHVYPTDHRAFGQEWTPGIDRDPHITVLNANLPGVGGYYSAEDLYPRAVNAFSNQRKMLYVSITSYELGTPSYASTIAHEFQHMIHWYQHERDDTWINEGSSMLAQVLNGYTADGFESAFGAAPHTQVDDFCEPGSYYCEDNVSIADYGAAFQWMLYFYQHYGGDKATRALLADKGASGMAAFDDVLARLGSRDDAREMFRKWTIANLVDDPRLDGGAYGYQPTYPGCCIHSTVTLSTTLSPGHSYTHQGQLNQFASDYVELKPSGPASTLRLRFNGDPTVRVVPNTPVQGGSEWWSNRGDEMDSTLTHSFDLRHVRKVTLQYDLWYDVEKDFDYGYVEVSDDGGRTWHTLQGRYTTNADPNGANYGNGYTGASVKQKDARDSWLHESIDLSRYAGHQIMVRFEHITDDANNLDGLTLDNVRIPEIGFVDSPGSAGWQSHGWVRISNILPTRWLAQLVLYTAHGVEVRQVPLSSVSEGQATVNGFGGDVQRVVVALSPTATQTTVPSSYTLSVQ